MQKSESNAVPVCPTKICRGSKGKAPLILTSIADAGEWSTSHPNHFTPGKNTKYALNRELGGPQSCSAYFGLEENLLHMLGICTYVWYQQMVYFYYKKSAVCLNYING